MVGMAHETTARIAQEAALEDARWVQQVRLGDDKAVVALIDRHRLRLVRVATNILRSQTDAEDVAQDAFLRAFREIKSLRDDRAFAGYLYRIVVRLCMDKLRSRRPEVSEWDGVQPDEGVHVENRIVVRKLLDQLSPELRLTLVLREMEQLSYEEVADMMKVPVGTVRSRLHTARERFRDLWIKENKDAI